MSMSSHGYLSNGDESGDGFFGDASSCYAPDVLPKTQNWSELITSSVTDIVSDGAKYFSKIISKSQSGGSNDSPKYNKITLTYPQIVRLHKTNLYVYVFICGADVMSVWRGSLLDEKEAMELLYINGDDFYVDGAIYSASGMSDYLITISNESSSPQSLSPSDNSSNSSGNSSTVVRKRYLPSGVICKERSVRGRSLCITAGPRFSVLGQAGGVVKVLCSTSLDVVAELLSAGGASSALHAAPVFSLSERWIAIQISKSQYEIDSKLKPSAGSKAGGAELEDGARWLVNSAFHLTRRGWESLGPLVQKMYHGASGNHGANGAMVSLYQPDGSLVDEASLGAGPRPPTGGGGQGGGAPGGVALLGGAVAVLDISRELPHFLSANEGSSGAAGARSGEGSPTASSETSSSQARSNIKIVCKFLAHDENIVCMQFSPSGLMLASASESGQVINVHTLCPSGSLYSSNRACRMEIQAGYARHSHEPQLTHRLVRGYTLSNVISISFDSLESMITVASSHGSLHAYDIDRLSADRAAASARRRADGAEDRGRAAGELASAPGSHLPPAVSDVNELIVQQSMQAPGIAPALQTHRSLKVRLPSRDSTVIHVPPIMLDRPVRVPGVNFAQEITQPSDITLAAVGFSTVALSCSSIRSSDASIASQEVYAVSSQGYLSKYRLERNSSQKTASTDAANGAQQVDSSNTSSSVVPSSGVPPVAIEQHRWDLFADPCSSPNGRDTLEHTIVASAPAPDSSIESGAKMNGHGSAPRPHPAPPIPAPAKKSSSPNASAAWLAFFGNHQLVYSMIDRPLWARPQVQFQIRVAADAKSDKDTVDADSALKSFLQLNEVRSLVIGALRSQIVYSPSRHNRCGAVESGSPQQHSIVETISSAISSDLSVSEFSESERSGRLVLSRKRQTPLLGAEGNGVVTSPGPAAGSAAPAPRLAPAAVGVSGGLRDLDDWDVPSVSDWGDATGAPAPTPMQRVESVGSSSGGGDGIKTTDDDASPM